VPLKEVSPPFQVVASASVSGLNTFTSSVSGVLYKDVIVYSTVYTGVPTGYIEVQASVDYNQGIPQSAGGQNNGSWVTIASVSVGSGTPQPIVFNLRQLGLPYTRMQFVSNTSSGVIGTHFTAKSF